MRSAPFCDFTQRRMVVCYRRFGTTYRSHLQGSSSPNTLKIGPIVCTETSVTHYCSTLRKIPEQRRPQIMKFVQKAANCTRKLPIILLDGCVINWVWFSRLGPVTIFHSVLKCFVSSYRKLLGILYELKNNGLCGDHGRPSFRLFVSVRL